MKKIFLYSLLLQHVAVHFLYGRLWINIHVDETSRRPFTPVRKLQVCLGKIYTSMVTTGQEKNGNEDLSSNSGQDYMRCYFNLQECGTDEVASIWLSVTM